MPTNNPVPAPSNRTSLYLSALIAVTIVAYVSLEILRPGALSVEGIGRISAIILPAIIALIAAIQATAAKRVSADNNVKLTELTITVDGRLSKLLKETRRVGELAAIAARREGYERGVLTDPESPMSMAAGEQSLADADAKAAVDLYDPPWPPHTK